MEILAKIITAILVGGLGFLVVYEVIKMVQDFKKRKAKKLAQKESAENTNDRKEIK